MPLSCTVACPAGGEFDCRMFSLYWARPPPSVSRRGSRVLMIWRNINFQVQICRPVYPERTYDGSKCHESPVYCKHFSLRRVVSFLSRSKFLWYVHDDRQWITFFVIWPAISRRALPREFHQGVSYACKVPNKPRWLMRVLWACGFWGRGLSPCFIIRARRLSAFSSSSWACMPLEDFICVFIFVFSFLMSALAYGSALSTGVLSASALTLFHY